MGSPRQPRLNYDGNIKRSLNAPVVITNSEVAILTAGNGGLINVYSLIICDKSGSGDTVTIRKYASTLGNSSSNNLFTAQTVAVNDTLILDFPGGLPLYNGQILAALSGTGGRLTMDVCYSQEQ